MGIVKSELVLNLVKDDLGITDEDSATVIFQHPDVSELAQDRSPDADTEFLMSKYLWENLGKPDMVTVSIVAGDVLSEIGDSYGATNEKHLVT